MDERRVKREGREEERGREEEGERGARGAVAGNVKDILPLLRVVILATCEKPVWSILLSPDRPDPVLGKAMDNGPWEEGRGGEGRGEGRRKMYLAKYRR
jgi:hypothetical protein